MKIFALSANKDLSHEITDYLDLKNGEISIRRFNDSEVFPEILENVRGEDVFLVQSTNNPANENLMELLITIDAARRGSARRITAVIPYFGYARQDRKTGPRSPISAKLVANLLTTAGADRILTIDLHSGPVQGFFDIPLDNLYASSVFLPLISKRFKDDELVIVSPDVGGVVRARTYASKLKCDLAIIDKRRPKVGEAKVMHVIGDVKDRTCILVDDMVDSGGTLCNAATALLEKGAKAVHAYCSHGVFSVDAVNKINKSDLTSLVTTNTITPRDAVIESDRIETISIAPFIGEAMKRIHEERSVSSLFNVDL